ncbi:unnamed protein product [Didymodactylos carnosus]|uniref:Tetratricopeptide repeat protein n=2 Tax=Didymodactylos carnosus TaxID=1234261 RepID=A0A815YA19_9BILA|nr:unnamed protein product [Didymodactylos carnosus]CAF4430539.1 unnamed protein product [Didymodactylos carnosus]
MLNRGLRLQDIDIVFTFRSFIQDLYQQLQQEYETRTTKLHTIIRLYRGQVISADELEIMKDSIGGLLSMNSFLSASGKKSAALAFAKSIHPSAGFHPVLFELEADPTRKTKPFGHVRDQSYFKEEDEWLFMLGSVFRITGIHEDSYEKVWIVQMKLCDENDFELKEVFGYYKAKLGRETTLDSVGNLLYEMGEVDKAEKYYHRVVNELPPDSVLATRSYTGLGHVADDKGDYAVAFEFHNRVLSIRLKVLSPNHPLLGYSYVNIAGIYYSMKNYDQALEMYNKASEIFNSSLPVNHQNIGHNYNNISLVYAAKEDYEMAMRNLQNALKILEKSLPAKHPDVSGRLFPIKT